MVKELRQIIVAAVVGIALAMAALSCSGCPTGSTADARVRSALDMAAIAVDPVYSATMDACALRQALIADDVEAGRRSPDDAKRALLPIRQRCHQARDAFETIRAAHTEAVRLVESGELAKAEALVAEIRAQLSGLPVRADPCPPADGGEGTNPACEGGAL